MELKEFVEGQKALLDDFVADYERQRKKKGVTMIRPNSQWKELYEDFKQCYEEVSDEKCYGHSREDDPGHTRAA